MAKLEVQCVTCGKLFLRSKSEVARSVRKGMRVFCSQQCRGRKLWEDTPSDRRVSTPNLPPKELDELSPFRPHLKTIKCHAKKIGRKVLLDAGDLKLQWERQGGQCALTGWTMINYRSTQDRPPRCPQRASVDRLDSNKDYTVDNIRFICMMGQFAKNNFTDHQLREFCEAVVRHGISEAVEACGD